MFNFEKNNNGIKNCYSQSQSLGIIKYWDSEGVEKQTELSESKNWKLNKKESGNTTLWSAVQEEIELQLSIELSLNGADASLKLPCSSIKESKACRLKNITLFPEFIGAKDGDTGSLLIPFNSGVLCKTSGKKATESDLPIFSAFNPYCNMPLCGIDYGDGHAMSLIIDGGTFDCTFRIRTCWGKEKLYSIDPVFAFREYIDEKRLNEDISLYYHLHEGKNANYAGIGRYYRLYNQTKRDLPTLAEKIKNNEVLEYSSKAISIRFRIGVKPMPATILEQTTENQPPVKIFMSFDDVKEVIEECSRQEVGPAEFCLVGWNYGGHDGAFPQLFPIAPEAGGEEKLREITKRAIELGYHMTLHDNYHDIYTLANNYDENSIAKNHDGSKTLGGCYGGGQAYIICPKIACEKYVEQSFSDVAELGIKGAYYVDVLSIADVPKCYDEKHPLSRREFAEWRKRIMAEQQRVFKGSYSEGGRDWAFPDLDRAYQITGRPDLSQPYADEEVPLYHIAYHGFLIYNSFRCAVNTLPGNDIYLLNIAYGGIPMIYYHHIFNPDWNDSDGWTNDFVFDRDNVSEGIATIKQITNDVARLEKIRFAFIEDFIKHDDNLTETVYSNGLSLFVNYSKEECKLQNKATLPPKDFLLV